MNLMLILATLSLVALGHCDLAVSEDSSLYIVEGRVFPVEGDTSSIWQKDSRVLVNGGEYIGFLK
jgi:hypothetical protein